MSALLSPSPADETVIVGGGPAGMLLAHLRVKGGQPVHVVERHPDFAREFRGEGIDFGIILLQERVLTWLHERLLATGLYRVTFSASAEAARPVGRCACSSGSGLPILDALGVRRRLLSKGQSGVTSVRVVLPSSIPTQEEVLA